MRTKFVEDVSGGCSVENNYHFRFSAWPKRRLFLSISHFLKDEETCNSVVMTTAQVKALRDMCNDILKGRAED